MYKAEDFDKKVIDAHKLISPSNQETVSFLQRAIHACPSCRINHYTEDLLGMI